MKRNIVEITEQRCVSALIVSIVIIVIIFTPIPKPLNEYCGVFVVGIGIGIGILAQGIGILAQWFNPIDDKSAVKHLDKTQT